MEDRHYAVGFVYDAVSSGIYKRNAFFGGYGTRINSNGYFLAGLLKDFRRTSPDSPFMFKSKTTALIGLNK